MMRFSLFAAILFLSACGGGGGGNNDVSETNNTIVESETTSDLTEPSDNVTIDTNPSDNEVTVDTDTVTVDNGNLPTGEPADNRLQEVDLLDNDLLFFDGAILPNLIRVSSNNAMPSFGGLDSTSEQFDALRYPNAESARGCDVLFNAMVSDRGESEGVGFHRPPTGAGYASMTAHWYFDQGYVIAYASPGELNYTGPCEFIDYRFTPQEKPIAPPTPDPVEFAQVETGFTSFGAPTVTLRVTNNQSIDIFNVACDVNAIEGNTVLDSAFVLFASGATIASGRNAEGEGIFFDLASIDGVTLELDCNFLNR